MHPEIRGNAMTTTVRKCALLAVAAAMAAAAPSAAAEITWKAQVWGPKRASALPFEWYAKEVAAKTGGQMKIELSYDKGKPADSIDLLKSGAVEGAYFCAQYFPDKMTLATVLDLPMFSPD